MSSGGLYLFPTPPTGVPGKSALKKPVSAAELQSRPTVSEVNREVSSPPKVQPAGHHFKHSLFCQPGSTQNQQIVAPGLSHEVRGGRKASAQGNPASTDTPVSPGGDGLGPLPSESPASVVARSASLKRSNSARSKRSLPVGAASPKRSRDVPAIQTDYDRRLPSQNGASSSSPSSASSAYTKTPSLRSARSSPSLAKSYGIPSPASSYLPEYEPPTVPLKSMFPVYDHSKPLNQQQYFPKMTPHGNMGSLPQENGCKDVYPPEKRDLKRADSAMELVDGYEHIAVADDDDLCLLFKASTGKSVKFSRKVQLNIHQPKDSGISLSIGSSMGSDLYTLTTTRKAEDTTRTLSVTKHHPREKTVASAAQLNLRTAPSAASNPNKDFMVVTNVFPHLAALKAIEAVATSPEASAIANFDPRAMSTDAARLAHRAISNARCSHDATLVRKTRGHDSMGAATACYELQHPSLTNFSVSVSRSNAMKNSRLEPKAKISLHHPSATPAAIAAETLVLASLDFARNSCTLDLPGLMALDSPYVLDTAVCTLFAVAVAENDSMVTETMVFDPPPLSATLVKEQSKASRRSRSVPPRSSTSSSSAPGELTKAKSKKWYKAFSTKGKEEREPEKQPELEELPAVTQATLALLGLSLKTAVFVLEAGVKVTAGLVIGASHLASKN